MVVDQYPLPRVEDLMSQLSGGQKFSKIDLSQAYQQVQLDEASRKFVTINTHKGLYQYTRVPFGIASAPALFQKIMDAILQGIPSTICYNLFWRSLLVFVPVNLLVHDCYLQQFSYATLTIYW